MKEAKHSFLRDVVNQIKSKEAKEFVSAELQHHIKEAKVDWIKKGFNEQEAERKAVKQMGSPIQLGQQLNKLHRPKMDWFLIVLLITTFGLGFLPLFTLSSDGLMDLKHFATYKAIAVLVGGLTTIGLMYYDYRKLKTKGWWLFAVAVFMLLLLQLFPGTTYRNGLIQIIIGPLSINALMTLPLFYLAWASLLQGKKHKTWHLSGSFLLTLYLFLAIGDLSTTFIYTAMVVVMVWWANFGRKKVLAILLWPFLLLVACLLIFPFLKAYQKVRLLAFLHPEDYASGAGYMYLRVKEFLMQAGWFGNAVSQEFIPEAHTNFVFVSLTYYFGWLFASFIVLILSLFVVRMIMVGRKVKDPYGKQLLVGGITLYSVPFIYNIGMIVGLFPMMGISLPFISYGLMPILLNAVIIGMVLSVYRRKDLVVKVQ